MRGKNRRFIAELERQLKEAQIRRPAPKAAVLEIVDNGPEHGWKWLVWDYDPDQTRLMAGQIEGICVPHGMESGNENMEQARTRGLAAIRKSGWTGDVVLREPVPHITATAPLPFSESSTRSDGYPATGGAA